MDKVKIESFKLIGIAVRTTNENNQAATDIGELWSRFMAENIADAIPNKIDATVYSLYTDYQSDHTKPYTTILGCQVSDLGTIPDDMVGRSFDGGNYVKTAAKGNLSEGVVYQQWLKIWGTELDRRYTVDYEVYGEKAQNPADAEIDIFIAVN